MRTMAVVVFGLLVTSCARGMGPSPMPATQDVLPLAGIDYKLLYSFESGEDAGYPEASLIGVNGTLYGTTYGGGGGYEWGTVFSIDTAGKEHVLYRFKANDSGKYDGAHPLGALIDVGGTLYGTTEQGGTAGSGTVFGITPAGKEHIVYSFKGGSDGQYPYSTLIEDGGALYGTTYQGGVGSGWGVVFKVTTTGSEHVLYRFKAGNDGAHPYAGLTLMGGKLYGTTEQGGTTGSGTVFSITTGGTEHVVYSFKGKTDGQYPLAGLLDYQNELFGTTYQGGAGSGWGVVFKVNAAGSENVLYRFRANDSSKYDGAHPEYSGVSFADGKFYGTTSEGGTSGAGTVYSVTLGGAESILYSFKGSSDGLYPYAGLHEMSGVFYGTTWEGGGSDNAGTVFRISP